jgi:diguanylate cyclase (GGDEF)-like protein/PAS domain S-box-containing protein
VTHQTRWFIWKNNAKINQNFGKISFTRLETGDFGKMNRIYREAGNSNQLSLKDSELRYRRLFETAQDGILILDAVSGLITDVNPYLIKMLGYSRKEFLEKKLWEVGAFKDMKANEAAFRDLQEKEFIRYKDLPLRTKAGRLIQVEFVSNVYLVGKEKVIQCNIRNITKQKQVQDALLKSEAAFREQSMRDHLTGLFNRRYLEETLKRELLRAKRKNILVGIIMLDIDNFKHYNDTFGHAAGDVILKELGKVILEHVRSDDIPSRYGGDEFIIVLPDASLEVVRERAEEIREDVHEVIIQFHGKVLKNCTISMGAAIFPKNGSTYETLLKSVDKALYQAKVEGRDKVMVAAR